MTSTSYLNRCHFGDVRAVLRDMAAAGVQVHTIVTSPPYWGLRSYLPADHPDKAHEIGSEPTVGEFVSNMVEVFDLCRQVLRDDGTMWVNMGDSYAGARGAAWGPSPSSSKARSMTASRRRDDAPIPRSDVRVEGLKPKDLVGQPWRLAFALQDDGWWLRQEIIWHKPNPMPESVRDRCTKAHETIFLLAKSESYYFDQGAIKEPAVGGLPGNVNEPKSAKAYAEGATEHRTKAGLHAYSERKRRESIARGGFNGKTNALPGREAFRAIVDERNKRSVWTVATSPYAGAHFAVFPSALIEPCILAGAPTGGIVLDPFFGSGTTGQVAQQLGRQFIGIDINRANEPLQAERLRQPAFLFEPSSAEVYMAHLNTDQPAAREMP